MTAESTKPLERIERPLDPVERRWLRLCVRDRSCRVDSSLVMAPAFLLLPIWFIAGAIARRHPGIVTAAWMVASLALTLEGHRRKFLAYRSWRAQARRALEQDRAIELRVRSESVIEFGGSATGALLYSVGDDTSLLVYPAGDAVEIAKTEFSLSVVQADDQPLLQRVARTGRPLVPLAKFPLEALDEVLGEEPTFEGMAAVARPIQDVLAQLRGAPNEGRYR